MMRSGGASVTLSSASFPLIAVVTLNPAFFRDTSSTRRLRGSPSTRSRLCFDTDVRRQGGSLPTRTGGPHPEDGNRLRRASPWAYPRRMALIELPYGRAPYPLELAGNAVVVRAPTLPPVSRTVEDLIE